MLYLLAFFISPLALLLAGMPFQAILNLVLYVLAIVLTFVGLILFSAPGILIWALAVAHAVLMIHNKRAERRAQRIIDAIEKSDGSA